jgi:hypothetical protein
MQETTYTNSKNADKLIVIHNGDLVEEVWLETGTDRFHKKAGSRLNWRSFTNLLQYWSDFNLIKK